MKNQKLKILSEINKKIHDFQNIMKVQLEYADGGQSSFDLLEDEDIWVQDEEFGIGSRYKTLVQFNKPDEKDLVPTLFEGKEGNVVKTHNHRESHLFICIEGIIKVTLDEKKELILKPTQSLYINSYQLHKFEFISDAKLLILVLNI